MALARLTATAVMISLAAGCEESAPGGPPRESGVDQAWQQPGDAVSPAPADLLRAELPPLPIDAGRDAAARDGKPPAPDAKPAGCGEFAGATRFTCSKDGNSRGKCVGGVPTVESCANGCLRKKAPADDVCMGTTTSWSCSGSYGTTKAENGDYYITVFGCWVDSKGVPHGDPGDNCIPACLSQAKSSGLCQGSWSGKTCEEKTGYYTADSGRFGCLQRLRITNPANGKRVIAVALDAGPACWVENNVKKAILDVSAPVALHLFGGSSYGASEKKLVHVVEVDNATPLGPLP
jgi:hypothetical protein